MARGFHNFPRFPYAFPFHIKLKCSSDRSIDTSLLGYTRSIVRFPMPVSILLFRTAKLISKKFSNRNRASRTAEYLRSKVNRIKCGLSEQYLSNEMLADLETFSTDRCFVPATVPSSTYRSLPTTFACSEKSIFRHPYLLSYSLQFSSTVEARRVSPILKAGTSRHAGGTARRAGNPTLILSF